MFKVNVRETDPHAVRSGTSELSTMESSEWAAYPPVGVWEKINLIARVEKRVPVSVVFFATRRLEKTRASGVIACTPVALNLGILS